MAIGEIFYDTTRMIFFIQRESSGDERTLLLSRGVSEDQLNRLFGVEPTGMTTPSGKFWMQIDVQCDIEKSIDLLLCDGVSK